MKTLVSYKLLDEAVAAVEAEAERTGKTKTAVIEDALLMRRQFGEEADAAVLREPVRGVRSIRVLADHLRVGDRTVRRWLRGEDWPPVTAVREMRAWVRSVTYGGTPSSRS